MYLQYKRQSLVCVQCASQFEVFESVGVKKEIPTKLEWNKTEKKEVEKK